MPSAEWIRVTNTTLRDYFKGVEGKLQTNQKVLAVARRMGRIVYKQTGTDLDWAIPYRQAPMQSTTLADQINPTQQDRYKRLNVAPKGFQVNDLMTERDRLINGPDARTQLINYYAEMPERLGDDIEQQWGLQFFKDDSTETTNLTGLESMFAINGTTNITDGTQRSANAADIVGYPNDTYGGLSTALGQIGSWGTQSGISSTWPNGTGSLSYDFSSPVVVNYDSDNLDGSTHTWAGQGVSAMRFGIMAMRRYDPTGRAMRMILLDGDLYRRVTEGERSKEQMQVTNKNSLYALGFTDTFVVDGVEVSWEYGVTAGCGYGINMNNVSYHSYFPRIFRVMGPTEEPLSQFYYTVVKSFGNWKFKNPSRFMKLALLAT